VTVNQRRAVPRTAVSDRFHHGVVAGDGIGAVDLGEVEVWKVCDQARYVAAWRVRFDRSGDGVAVIFDDEEKRKLAIAGRVESLPELALAGGALSNGDVGHLIAMEDDVLELAIVSFVLCSRLRMLCEVAPRLGAPHGMKALGGS
jgi:hypothetical protein